MRFFSEPSLSSRFSDDDILMLVIPDFSDGSPAVFIKFPHFSGRQLDEYDLEQIIFTDQ
jgi:hypothetical protein